LERKALLSRLSIFDLDKGSAESVHATTTHIEAPNWTPDGAALVVNGSGRLYRVPLSSPGLEAIDAGFAVNINNDHGVSPDGKSIVISDSTENGESCIYAMPISGGTPRKITELTPSYWHGWSPDGRILVYVGKRGATYRVHTCPFLGGPEKQLTDAFDHCDGPDYTADGQWIWFNGEREGDVQLWRMRPDGTGVQRMTNDRRVNWFPHPSPNGKHILYLAYESGTRGHPAMQSVELRLIPATGGEPKTLLRITGGQGTMNVPCWAPDSRKFAFVSYEN
jgi:Tol biopolymer transport system component